MRFPNLTSPSGTGESRAEAQRRQGVFDLVMGVARVNELIKTSLGDFWVTRFLLDQAVAENCSDGAVFSPLNPPLRRIRG